MRKLWLRRRAVSTMIGGIIVLALFLTALVATLVLSQQYDVYHSAASQMETKYIDRSTEKLVGTAPGVVGPYQTGTPVVNQYSMYVTNVAGIGSEIARIYINSSSTSHGCYPAPCILNPSTSSSPVANTFRASDGYINPGEFSHQVIFWLDTTRIMRDYPDDPYGSHSFTTVTKRGGLFTFHYPFPPLHSLGGGPGGTGIFIGPLVIIFEPILISYTSSSPWPTKPQMPIGPPVWSNLGWQFPLDTALIFYIKVYNQGINPVTITSETLLQIQPFGKPSQLVPFWIVAPMSDSYCQGLKVGGIGWDPNPVSDNWNLDCSSSFSGGNTFPGATGGSKNIAKYDFTNHPYIIPTPMSPGSLGKPVYLLFSWDGNKPKTDADSLSKTQNKGPIVSFLELGFQYNDGTGMYTWGVNLPFVSGCGGSFGSDCPTT